MNFRNLTRLLSEILQIWIKSLCHPLTTIRQLLIEFEQNRSLASATTIWATAISLSVVINYPLVNLFGIEWNNIGFYAPDELLVIVWMIITVILIHFSLRLFGIKSQIYPTALVFTLYVIYSPLTTMVMIPVAYKNYAFIQSIKLQVTEDPWETMKRLFLYDLYGVDLMSLNVGDVVMYCTHFLGLLTFAAFAECLVQVYRSPRHTTYLAVGSAKYLVGLAYVQIAFPMHSLIAYSFVKPA